MQDQQCVLCACQSASSFAKLCELLGGPTILGFDQVFDQRGTARGRRGTKVYAMTAAMSPTQVRSMYKEFLTLAKKFPNYNIREYVRRKAREGFRGHASESDPATLQQLWSKAQQDLAVTQRQAVVYSLYASRQKSVMDIPMVKVLQKQAEDAPYDA